MEETFDFENPARHGVGGEQLEGVLAEVGVSIEPAAEPYMDESVVALTKNDGTIDDQKVYNELAGLIAVGKNVVNKLNYVDVNAEGALAGMASVLSSMRQMLNDFSKIHQDHLKFKRQIDLERMKIDAKREAMERKHQMDLEKIKLTRGSSDEEDNGDGKPKLGYSQADTVRAIAEARRAAEADAEKRKKLL